MGGAQPLAATMAGASMIAVECQPSRIEMRLRTRYLDAEAKTIDEALEIVDRSHKAGKPISSACSATPPKSSPNWWRAASARMWSPTRPRPMIRSTAICRPAGRWRNGKRRAKRNPKSVELAAKQSMATHVKAMLDFHRMGVPTLDYGNNIRQMAKDVGVADAFAFPGFVPAYIRPLFCRGIGPFRWARCPATPRTSTRPTPG
jgi:urocanate hydratase